MQFSIIKCTVCFSSYKVKLENNKCSTSFLDSYTHTSSFYSKHTVLCIHRYFIYIQTHSDFCLRMQQYSILARDTLDEYYKFSTSILPAIKEWEPVLLFLQESAGIHKYITNRSKLSCGDLVGRMWLIAYRLTNIYKQPAASTPSDHTMPLPEDHNSIK